MPYAPSLDRQAIFHEIVHEHGMDPLDYYLLPLMPLIAICWADERVQKAEAELLLDFTRRWLVVLRQDADGETIVSSTHAQRFLDRFVKTKPDPALLERLCDLALDMLEQNSDPQRVKVYERTVLEYCIDIAAAAVQCYPYDMRGRVMEQEKNLLLELMHAMQINPHDPLQRRI